MKLFKLSAFVLCICMYQAASAQQTQADSLKIKVLFYLDKYYLTDSAKQVLNVFLAKYSNRDSLIMDGYCDFRAGLAYNDRLAENRIVSVANYLHAKGFNQTASFIHQPHGKRITLDFRKNEDGYAQNRAVLITVKEQKIWAKAPLAKAEPETDANAGIGHKTPSDSIVKPTPPPPAVDSVVVSSTEPPTPIIFSDTVFVTDDVHNKEEQNALVKKIEGYIKNGKVGRSIVVTSVYFLEGRHVFVKSSLPVLEAVSTAIKSFPEVKFELQGHVCCTDQQTVDALDFDSKMFDLSVERVKAVHDYLVKVGVDEGQLYAMHGFGSRNRLFPQEKTATERDRNRRVQFVIVKK